MDNVNAFLASQGLRETKLRRKMMDLKAAGEGAKTSRRRPKWRDS